MTVGGDIGDGRICGSGSIVSTVAKSGIALGVTLAQWAPPSWVRCTSPSSLPTQIRSWLTGDSATAKMVS